MYITYAKYVKYKCRFYTCITCVKIDVIDVIYAIYLFYTCNTPKTSDMYYRCGTTTLLIYDYTILYIICILYKIWINILKKRCGTTGHVVVWQNFWILFLYIYFFFRKNHYAPVSQANRCNMTFTAGNLFPSYTCIGWPESSPHRDSNLGPQDERQTTYQLSYPPPFSYILMFEFRAFCT